jgi:hypothetical protein
VLYQLSYRATLVTTLRKVCFQCSFMGLLVRRSPKAEAEATGPRELEKRWEAAELYQEAWLLRSPLQAFFPMRFQATPIPKI